MGDRRDMREVRLVQGTGRQPVDDRLHRASVPRHDDVGEQRKCAGDRGRLGKRASMLGLDPSSHQCTLQQMDRLTL